MTLTLRVYGFLIDTQKGLLVSDEYIRGTYFTKLPGGGLEMGEGTRDCLAREFLEETGVEVTVGAHIYTTDYFQPSAFRADQQFMGIYYFVHAADISLFKTHEKSFDFRSEQIQDPNGEAEVLRWIPYEQMSPDIFQLPTDKIAMEIVLEKLKK
ncbi:MAG: NUDIX domain-containing protein [Chitinophagaceae bacterium]